MGKNLMLSGECQQKDKEYFILVLTPSQCVILHVLERTYKINVLCQFKRNIYNLLCSVFESGQNYQTGADTFTW